MKSFSPNAHFHLKRSKLHVVFQGGVCVRCRTQPDCWNCKNQSQKQIKPTPNEVLPMCSKYCSWVPRKWGFVSKGQPGDWGLGMVVPGPWEEAAAVDGIAAVDGTPPPSAGHAGDGAGFCYEQNYNTSLTKKSLKCKVLNPVFQPSGFFLPTNTSGNYISPVKSLALFNFMVAVIHLRHNL